MKQTLIVNNGEFEFTRFRQAVSELEEEYGYEGLAWEMVVASDDFDVLCDFLNGDGLNVELIAD
ncbi:hypothetical protein [Jeotgalibacillus haloalkalitolerans]|uniref:Uncharacterized protein n=1 Tax=Jeotgalibacillus haloalkalitolerans TaxID=3104292 RepID=A0ABU5KNF5_9BACL|nr:hypothetical protein [Jeotgalibacillus sp. HH7-29]MDZ5712261.1 hypothetical protein [Jeotgalibacillus sp. HH7-29]